MNTFRMSLTEALAERFNIDVVILVSKKKKHVHLSLKKPLFEFRSFEQIISFIKNSFEKKKDVFEAVRFEFP